MLYDSETVQALRRARSAAWVALQPAFDHAISMARECEFVADQAANLAQTSTTPAYPPLVTLLAQAATTEGETP